MTPALVARAEGLVTARLTVAAGEVIAVVGPNGAGKSTLLRALAGLPGPARAAVAIDGRDVGALPPHRRRVGYVPQDGALFPHLTASRNVAYGLRGRGLSRRQAQDTAREWLDRLGLSELAGRRPGQMSGGQQQRVALARALAPEPRLLLLDEPLAALDVETRTAVRHTLRRHLGPYDGACLLVTHDPVDALSLADRMLVIEAGAVVQDAPPAEVTRAPRSAWVARMLGLNAYAGQGGSDGVRLADGHLLAGADPAPRGPVLVTVHPDHVTLHRERPEGSERNVWRGEVAEVTGTGTRLRVSVHGTDGPDVVAEVTASAAAELGLGEGLPVWVGVKATGVVLTAL
ncbi:ABC transporter ATP-binding protein [Yinghuangia sp. YIM S10712]|uniref:ABC transporter ATP-binding protein n=1 Tax=Yinghuangia sp. YIM S10712 TaxID=3436930 RepID=UPI003F531207